MNMKEEEKKTTKPKHLMYCKKSGLRCLVNHFDEQGNPIECPQRTQCDACDLELIKK